jgi:hypothetical protein
MEIYVSSSQLCRYAQRKIADQLDKTPGEILKELEEVLNKII